MTDFTTDWSALKLQALRKAPLNPEEMAILERFRSGEELPEGIVIVLATFKMAAEKTFMKKVFKMCKTKNKFIFRKRKKIRKDKLKKQSCRELRATVTRDFSNAMTAVTGYEINEVEFDYGLFKTRRVPWLHDDKVRAIFLARLHSLPTLVVDAQHPNLGTKKVNKLLERAKKRKQRTKPIKKLQKKKILKPVRLGALVVISGKTTLHCSSLIRKKGRYSIFMRGYVA
ncbi:MAG TPA: hypothetical protein VHB73_06335 [Alphaproteobacteria bacterium]|nr:hypothetical protein [Alphaproteobacteria bacterium]